jgi:hypothetical protein
MELVQYTRLLADLEEDKLRGALYSQLGSIKQFHDEGRPWFKIALNYPKTSLIKALSR